MLFSSQQQLGIMLLVAILIAAMARAQICTLRFSPALTAIGQLGQPSELGSISTRAELLVPLINCPQGSPQAASEYISAAARLGQLQRRAGAGPESESAAADKVHVVPKYVRAAEKKKRKQQKKGKRFFF